MVRNPSPAGNTLQVQSLVREPRVPHAAEQLSPRHTHTPAQEGQPQSQVGHSLEANTRDSLQWAGWGGRQGLPSPAQGRNPGEAGEVKGRKRREPEHGLGQRAMGHP